MLTTCPQCEGCGWVCERHTEKPGKVRTRARAVPPVTLPGLQRHQRRRRAADAGRPQNRGRQRRLALLSWSTPFSEPIVLPNGKKLITLKDAAS
jgi:hypothetical protein